MLDLFREIYNGDSPRAHRFRYAILGFDLVTIAFVIVTSFFPRSRGIEIADALFGVIILSDFILRFVVDPARGRYFLRFTTWADVVAMIGTYDIVFGEVDR